MTDTASISDVEMVTAVRSLRAWLTMQHRFDRTDFVGAAARLVGGSKTIFDIHGRKNPPAGTNLVYKALQRLLDDGPDIGITPDERLDLIATLHHWDEIIAEWRAEAESVTVMSKEKGLDVVIPGPGDRRPEGGTAELPVPFAMCIMPSCRKTAVLGGDRCEKHGGAWLDPETRQAMLMASYERIVEATDIAVGTLIDVMENSRRDDARVAAAREILDRGGIRAGEEIHLHVHDAEVVESAVDIIKARLAEMHRNIEAGKAIDPTLLAGRSSDIEDAEVISDTDDPEDDESAKGEDDGPVGS